MTEFFRFYDRVLVGDSCWDWAKSCTSHGYGQLRQDGRVKLAHRVSWELWNGPIPAGMQVLHQCDRPVCVRPDHLFLGTAADNMRDMHSKGRGNRDVSAAVAERVRRQRVATATKTHCPEGHALTLYGNGRRRCRPCAADAARAAYWRSK